MANETLEDILNISAASGPFGTGDAVIQQVMRDFIQLESLRLSIGTNLVGVRSVPWLEYKWYTAGTGTFSYPIDDAAVVDPTKVGTESYTVKLEKGQGRTTFLDTVKLRGESFENMDRQQLAIAKGRADVIDEHILDKLLAGAGQTLAATGGGFKAADGDAELDILKGVDLIFQNARVNGNEALALVLPATHKSAMNSTTLYGNVVQSLAERLSGQINLTVYYTRDSDFASTALLMVPGAQTAELFTYNGPGVTETEITRMPGVGFDYLLTSYMGVVIHQSQDGSGAGVTNRIVKITGI
tara:strand:+ start:5491 stop:6387 length:897 start_codon:yes stop_codon:yes gene_type:complete